MTATYDDQGNYVYPEGFDPETGEWLEGFDEQEYRKYEELKSLFEFLDEIFSDDEDEEVDLEAPKKRRKRLAPVLFSIHALLILLSKTIG